MLFSKSTGQEIFKQDVASQIWFSRSLKLKILSRVDLPEVVQ